MGLLKCFPFSCPHKVSPLFFLTFAFFRLLWRIKEGWLPPIRMDQARWEVLAAKLIHIALLAASILMPLSGLTMSVAGGRGADIFGFVLFEKSETKIVWLAEIGKTIHFSAIFTTIINIWHKPALVLHVALDYNQVVCYSCSLFHTSVSHHKTNF